MSPIIIIPEEKETITLKTEELKKLALDIYYGGFHDGKENGRLEILKPETAYTNVPVSYEETIKLLNSAK